MVNCILEVRVRGRDKGATSRRGTHHLQDVEPVRYRKLTSCYNMVHAEGRFGIERPSLHSKSMNSNSCRHVSARTLDAHYSKEQRPPSFKPDPKKRASLLLFSRPVHRRSIDVFNSLIDFLVHMQMTPSAVLLTLLLATLDN